MKAIDQTILKRFLTKALSVLHGDWVLVGGSALTFMGISDRRTLDIDLANPKAVRNEDTLALMKIAEELGLPTEAINTAASFFLHKIPGWEKHLILIKKTSSAALHRPDASLYLLLKIQRLAEVDLQDCLLMMSYARKQGEAIAPTVRSKLQEELKRCSDPLKLKRLKQLSKALQSSQQKKSVK